MVNQIANKQNSERSIEYLAASSYLYSRVKSLVGFQIFLTVFVPIVLAISGLLFPETIKAWAALYGLSISLFDTYLIDKFQKDWKKEAAKVQEGFDCELFELKWNEFRVGDKLKPEQIHNASKKFLRKKAEAKIAKLKNWYSPYVQQLPLRFARIVCQRSNIYWDSELRRKYSLCLDTLALAIVIVGIVSGFALNMSITAFVVTFLAPIFPTLLWLLRESKRQRDSAVTLDRLMKYVEKLLNDIRDKKLTDDELDIKSREIQDELYSHRFSNQPVFNFVYKLLRRSQEEQMNVGAKELTHEMVKTLNS